MVQFRRDEWFSFDSESTRNVRVLAQASSFSGVLDADVFTDYHLPVGVSSSVAHANFAPVLARDTRTPTALNLSARFFVCVNIVGTCLL